MNASELHELVKNLPREAWPVDLDLLTEGSNANWGGVQCRVVCDSWWLDPRDADDAKSIGTDHAVLLFEASMMRWLSTRSMPLIVKNYGFEVELAAFDRDKPFKAIKAKSMIEALAAACRAVSQ